MKFADVLPVQVYALTESRQIADDYDDLIDYKEKPTAHPVINKLENGAEIEKVSDVKLFNDDKEQCVAATFTVDGKHLKLAAWWCGDEFAHQVKAAQVSDTPDGYAKLADQIVDYARNTLRRY